VYFAAQRTMLAWVRTGVALMGLGFVVARFGLFMREMTVARGGATPHPGLVSAWAGTGLLLIGVAVEMIGAARFAAFRRRFNAGRPVLPGGATAELAIAGVLAAIGLLLAVYLIGR
jgi:putative membrane protein